MVRRAVADSARGRLRRRRGQLGAFDRHRKALPLAPGERRRRKRVPLDRLLRLFPRDERRAKAGRSLTLRLRVRLGGSGGGGVLLHPPPRFDEPLGLVWRDSARHRVLRRAAAHRSLSVGVVLLLLSMQDHLGLVQELLLVFEQADVVLLLLLERDELGGRRRAVRSRRPEARQECASLGGRSRGCENWGRAVALGVVDIGHVDRAVALRGVRVRVRG